MIVVGSRKHRNPVSSGTKPIQPLFDMSLIHLVVSPGVDITMVPKVNQIAVVQSVIKQVNKAAVVTIATIFFIWTSN
jgi:hypothetical protein